MTYHHTEDSVCPLCEDKLKGCHPDLMEIFYSIKDEFPDCHIAWGYRGKEDQNALFKEGKTNAKWPRSAHNRLELGKPCSKAMDLFRLNDEGLAEFKKAYYLAIAQYLNKIGTKINWSGEWTKFKESNHFELEE